MRDLIGKNIVVEPTETQTYIPKHHSCAETVKRGSYFQYNECTYKVLDDFQDQLSSAKYKVISSTNVNYPVGFTQYIEYKIMHTKILRMFS